MRFQTPSEDSHVSENNSPLLLTRVEYIAKCMLNIPSTLFKYLPRPRLYSWADSKDLNYWKLFSYIPIGLFNTKFSSTRCLTLNKL